MPSMHKARLGLARPHDVRREFIKQVVTDSHKVWLSQANAREGLIKALVGPRGAAGMGPAGAAAAPTGGAALRPRAALK